MFTDSQSHGSWRPRSRALYCFLYKWRHQGKAASPTSKSTEPAIGRIRHLICMGMCVCDCVFVSINTHTNTQKTVMMIYLLILLIFDIETHPTNDLRDLGTTKQATSTFRKTFLRILQPHKNNGLKKDKDTNKWLSDHMCPFPLSLRHRPHLPS